jgi:dihydroorotase (multifunctional complex type)
VASVDLVIAGGTLVNPIGTRRAHLVIDDGRVVHVTHAVAELPKARTTFDASGLLVLPGAVDTHVHLMDPGSTDREDFPTGTAAAAASGVTTIVEHTHGQPVRTMDDLTAKQRYLTNRANVDFGLAAHAWPGHTDDVADLWAAGVAFFKVFTCTTHGVPGHNAYALREHLKAATQVGAVTLMHCEDESLTAGAEAMLRHEGRGDNGLLLDWRNRDAELVAASAAALLVRRTGARATIAHVSNQEVASYVAAERRKGARLQAEACPQYFLLREGEIHDHGTLRKFTPPARARTKSDEEKMWQLLREGVLTHMSTDHAPSTLRHKLNGDIWSTHFGLPGLDSTMSILLDAAARGHLSYEDVARVYAQNPAQTYGLWPRKGHLGVGAHADLNIVDPDAHRVLSNADVISKAGWTPFNGREVTGRVVRTYVRGRLVAEEGKPTDGRDGLFLAGSGAMKTNS